MFDSNTITPAWLTNRLQNNGYLQTGCVKEIKFTKTFGSSAVFFAHLEVVYDALASVEAPRHLFIKVFLESSWKVTGMRELTFFRDLNPQMPDSTAVLCYDVGIDPDESYCYLILQDLSKTHLHGLDENCSDQFVKMIERIAKVHAFWWGHPRLKDGDFCTPIVGPLRMVQATTVDVMRGYCKQLEEALGSYCEKFEDVLLDEWVTRCERIIAQWADLFCKRIEDEETLTLIHGDFGDGNMFRPMDFDAHDFCVIDWETCKRSIGPYDLTGRMIAEGGIDGEGRRAIEVSFLKKYHSVLVAQRVSNYSWDACLLDYRLSIMAFVFPPIFLGGNINFFRAVMRAFEDWGCEALLNES